MHFIERSYSHDNTNWWAPNRACAAAMLRSAGFRIEAMPEEEVFICRHVEARLRRRLSRTRSSAMIEAAMIWNEPNNKSHWDLEADPGWEIFAADGKLAGQAIAAEAPGLPRVLGGISPIDPDFIRVLANQGVLEQLDAVAVHGFPLDWNNWLIDEWPAKIATIQAVTDLPVWVSEVGISTFGAEEVQEWGLRRTAELLIGPRAAHPLV